VKLVKARLGEDTIIKVVDTQPGKYSLGVEDIIALKQAGVSEKIITAILTKPSNELVAAPETPPRVSEKQDQASQGVSTAAVPSGIAPSPVNEVGVYYKKGGAWVQVMPEAVNWQTGGVIKHVTTAGVVKGDVNGRVYGPHSKTDVAIPVEFLFRVAEGSEITEYQLIHCREHGGSREFRSVTGGVFHVSGGATRDLEQFDFSNAGERTFIVTMSNLKAGEYGFLAPGSAMQSHASAQLGKMYTFRVIE
jgi:hypothetical protein